MRASLSWLRDYVEIDVEPKELAEKLSFSGTKVEAIHEPGRAIEGVVVAEVLAIEEHPDADNLILVDVKTGDDGTSRVVCGARNFSVGDRVPFAKVGSHLPEMAIAERKIRGQASQGMLCSGMELGVSKDHSGILVLPSDASLGEEVVSVLGLDDVILELEITPNRPDLMSMVGLGREVAALLGHELRTPEFDLETASDVSGNVTVEINDPEGCPRYVARFIDNVSMGAAPAWMTKRLLGVGVRPVSNIVDVTNYVMFECGQPLHAFDAANITDRHIIVRRAKRGEKLTTLDGVERELHTDDLLIADPKRALAIAGVMGGEDSEVSQETRSVILESAFFEHSTIAFTSRRHLLRTEASARFEKKMDPEMPPFAAARAAQLMATIAGGRVAEDEVDEFPRAIEQPKLKLRPARTNHILGITIAPDEQVRHLRSIQIDAAQADDGSIVVTLPSFRPDLQREIDLVEEVARLAGLHRLPSTLPRGHAGGLERDQQLDRAIRLTLVGLGLHEAWTSAFSSPRDLDALELASDHPARRLVRISNPLGEETSALRTTLLPGLLRSAARNAAHRVPGVALFEIARVFEPTDEQLPSEAAVLGAVFSGRRTEQRWMAGEKPWDFFGVKGVLESLLDSLRIPPPKLEPATGTPFHPTRAARILVEGTDAGVIGELHPTVCENFSAPEGIIAFELALAPVLTHDPGRPTVATVPRFPAIYVDIAVVVDENVPAAKVEELIAKHGHPELASVRLFDTYRGEQVAAGKKSLAFALELRVPDRTMTDDEATAVTDRVVSTLKSELGAELRA